MVTDNSAMAENALEPSAHILIIAGVDPTGNAGIVQDIHTVTQFGLKACIAVSALTVQTQKTVTQLRYTEADFLKQQIEAAFTVPAIAAIKIGMLGTAAQAQMLGKFLHSRAQKHVILDPVLKASCGDALVEKGFCEVLRQELLPHISLLTPNLLELSSLTQQPLASCAQAAQHQAQLLLDSTKLGAVLIKGGHSLGEEKSTDYLITRKEIVCFKLPQINNVTLRGTGCQLASAIACYLAKNFSLSESIRQAKLYLQQKFIKKLYTEQQNLQRGD